MGLGRVLGGGLPRANGPPPHYGQQHRSRLELALLPALGAGPEGLRGGGRGQTAGGDEAAQAEPRLSSAPLLPPPHRPQVRHHPRGAVLVQGRALSLAGRAGHPGEGAPSGGPSGWPGLSVPPLRSTPPSAPTRGRVECWEPRKADSRPASVAHSPQPMAPQGSPPPTHGPFLPGPCSRRLLCQK